jgi:hypothetical protein
MLHYHLGLERGEVGLLPEGMSLDKIESSPAGPAYRAGYSWILAAQGRDDEAREQLEWVAADGFARLPMDMNWLAALAEMTQACAYLDDADTAAALAQQLEPYANRLILNARAVGSYGVGAYHLGILATVTGDFPAAEAWLEEAAAKHERLGARPLLARTRLAHAAALQVQGKSGAGELLEHVARDARQLRLDDLQRRATAALAGQVLLPHW